MASISVAMSLGTLSLSSLRASSVHFSFVVRLTTRASSSWRSEMAFSSFLVSALDNLPEPGWPAELPANTSKRKKLCTKIVFYHLSRSPLNYNPSLVLFLEFQNFMLLPV